MTDEKLEARVDIIDDDLHDMENRVNAIANDCEIFIELVDFLIRHGTNPLSQSPEQQEARRELLAIRERLR